MSRVDDEREAARTAARLAEQKRVEASQNDRKASENAKFARLVGEQKAAAHQTSAKAQAKGTIAQLLEAEKASEAQRAQQGEGQAEGQLREHAAGAARGQAALGDQVHRASRDEGAHTEGRQRLETEGGAVAARGQEGERASGARSQEGRRADARAGLETIEQRRADGERSSLGGAPAGRAGGKGGELKTDTEGGGGQQGQDGGKDPSKDGAAKAASLRFNPALMAPVPVALEKAATGSDRLRKVANELAQKIVERVRVGTNALGRAEFQVDFRQDVLAGLCVKVSAHNGKIRAVFSGKDRDVLKLVEQQTEALRSALAGRGLTLEDVKIEARP